ncbi:TorF family putative porin [Polynucleobacter sp. 39-46-10]|jgi:uncharacterized protein (TIGR02001 family)|uniref:TorF family putative porin n=1 Tax=Polynucleobacter sp. 39-46-10 TaxID=1970428 RepID=UPI000BC3CC07|nr:TorF family putative porin [Polynucleobacter sp. 39-46-10]OYY55612.1 MAG: hypothetical protein B7Y55_06560 [Polynucleobacter sp. 35-46-207]OZA72106.1 MAG: hypothetical protein B7X71_17610 [Polynucleobacter sp. 39-46-10]
MKTIQKTAIALVASGLFATAAFAADTPTNPEDAGNPIAANVTVVNDYRYRGITQTNYQPAIQGGFDYAHESGLYIGNWNSTISWIGDQNAGVSAPLEMDFYGGFKKELIAPGFASDFGVLQYYYPMKGFNGANNPSTTEIYAAQNYTFGPVTGFVKVNYAVSNVFGWANTTGAYYPDLTANYDTGIWGLSLNGHIGYQYMPSQSKIDGGSLSYMDWKLGATKDFGGGLALSASYVTTNANPSLYMTGSNVSANTFAGRGGAIVALTKTF